jgi:hypothetical protein
MDLSTPVVYNALIIKSKRSVGYDTAENALAKLLLIQGDPPFLNRHTFRTGSQTRMRNILHLWNKWRATNLDKEGSFFHLVILS